MEYCDKASELVYKVEHEFDLIERKYNKLIEQKTIFAKRALARIHYILQEGADDEDNIVKLINLIDKSDKTDEILGALRNRMKFTRQFYNVTDDSFREEERREEVSLFRLLLTMLRQAKMICRFCAKAIVYQKGASKLQR